MTRKDVVWLGGVPAHAYHWQVARVESTTWRDGGLGPRRLTSDAAELLEAE